MCNSPQWRQLSPQLDFATSLSLCSQHEDPGVDLQLMPIMLTEILEQWFSAFGGSRPLNIVSMQTAASPQKPLYPGPLRGPRAEEPRGQDSSVSRPPTQTSLTLLSLWLCHSWAWMFPFLPNVGTKVMCCSADFSAEKRPREGCVLGLIPGLSQAGGRAEQSWASTATTCVHKLVPDASHKGLSETLTL